jgi:hypothetical protein
MEGYRAQAPPETWPCECCGLSKSDGLTTETGDFVCAACALPLVRQQLEGAVEALRNAKPGVSPSGKLSVSDGWVTVYVPLEDWQTLDQLRGR